MKEIGWPLSFARQDICPGVRSPIASLYILCICLRLERMKATVDIELSFPVTHHLPTRHSGSIPRHIGDASVVRAAGSQTVAAARYYPSQLTGTLIRWVPSHVRDATVTERMRLFDQPSRYQFAVIRS